MIFILTLIAIVALIALVALVCTTADKKIADKRKEYLAECSRQELLQRQDEDNNLDKED